MTYAEKRGYTKLSKFESLHDFNNSFEKMMLEVKSEFTKSEYIALNKLRKYAGSDVVGVAWAKMQKVVSATWADAIGVSRSTFERMIRKAKKFNIITVKNEARSNGSTTHNVYVFNTADELVLPVAEADEIVSDSHTIDVAETVTIDGAITNILIKLPRLKDKKNTYATQSVVNKSADNSLHTKEQTPYQKLQQYIANFIDDKKVASKMYGIWRAHTCKMINKPSMDVAFEAVKHTVNAMRTKDIQSITGYFNNTLSNLIDKKIECDLRAAQVEYVVNDDIDLFECAPAVVVPQDLLDTWAL